MLEISRWFTRFVLLIAATTGWLASTPNVALSQTPTATSSVAWPAATTTSRPWTRWWWHGSAVDDANLTRLLDTYHEAGLGGVEITCIYGVQNNDSRNLVYRSDAWVDAVQHVLREANRLGMGVDLPAGSGWRMGGPNITMDLANSRVIVESDQAVGGKTFVKRFAKSTPQSALALNAAGEQVDLTEKIADGKLTWQVPEGDWTVYSLAYRWSGDRVKRPDPGGEGININPYWKHSVNAFLTDFDSTLNRLPGVRAQFHDSFEYQGDWQPEFLDAFAKRRGFRLEAHLPALAGEGDRELIARVKSDYRETISDLLLEDFIGTWVAWSHQHDQLARNQSHGSPANWLDLYAACDIPETESFGRVDGGDAEKLVFKFASSAANVTGKSLASSETATWLGEHFTVGLSDIQQVVDKQMLGGINHILYHGTAYSPDDASWPGWLFYASTQLNPQNPIWHDFPALNQYVTRCQSMLQASQPDNEVLLYWPIYDLWHDADGMRRDITVHNSEHWLRGQPIGHAARWLDDQGVMFDYVSDRQLAKCSATDHKTITTAGGEYKLIVIPEAKHLPLATLEHLIDLAEAGATVAFRKHLPESDSGLAGLTPSQPWKQAIAQVNQLVKEQRMIVCDDLQIAAEQAGLTEESGLKTSGIDFLRKKYQGSKCYFLKNTTSQAIDQWTTLGSSGNSVAILDPMTGNIGLAESKSLDSGSLSVRLQMAAGGSLFLLVSDEPLNAEPWLYHQVTDQPVAISGTWQIEFVEGGPSLPESFSSPQPVPWTNAPDQSAQSFAGTVRYSTSFSTLSKKQSHYLLDLGKVDGSARVMLNGEQVATLIGSPYQVMIDTKTDQVNELQIEVTGVAANRIRDLDRRGVEWRIFEDINVVNMNYKPFDASDWPVRPLGLSGPVTLQPVK
ncbi:glycosyl hydrolase [Aeoliella mucimassa]|uniref:Glycosyl hydrolases family 2, sugar binding domain n=1 Tax=Aeoliella mucimassa TaxID=2527972 RepID=A0A518ANF7_9BACT|nr:glycosyl hydrolase [Aeoliella mucimassa]QDU56231.1 hypothetical protein Pan181_24390 [Aeoliella mucimassa]